MSTATSIGVFGNQLGVALGFVIPAMVVRDQNLEENYHQIGMRDKGVQVFIFFFGGGR